MPHEGRIISEAGIPPIIKKYDYFESSYNPKGTFRCQLIQTAENNSALDLATGIRWQFAGNDINSLRRLQSWIKEINQKKLDGYEDWRLPTVEEALSFLKGEKGNHGFYIHPYFDSKQGYIFTVDRRKPGGVLVCRFPAGPGVLGICTMAGGFARLCRTSA